MDIARIVRTLTLLNADIIALQEVDEGITYKKASDVHQAKSIAGMLAMGYTYFPVRHKLKGRFGLALLSRYPMEVVKAALLPSVQKRARFEKRGAQWIELKIEGQLIQIINTHLSLFRKERLLQAHSLLGDDWLGKTIKRVPTLLVGDLNTWTGTLPYDVLKTSMQEVGEIMHVRQRLRTFPARKPITKLDHIFVSKHFKVHSAEVLSSQETQGASDHLPVVAELCLRVPGADQSIGLKIESVL